MTVPGTISFPSQTGVWRLGRSPDPYGWRHPQPVDTRDPGAGNRFDSFHGNFGVMYAATTVEACFAECLARFRPKPQLAELVRSEWATNGWMTVGSVPADWRDSRVLVRLDLVDPLPFIDITHPDTMQAVHEDPRLAGWLGSFGYNEVDLGHVISRDRRVTRLISQWAAESMDDDQPLYGGIKYQSRLGAQYECWAIFEGNEFVELERRPVLTHDPDLCVVSDRYRINVH